MKTSAKRGRIDRDDAVACAMQIGCDSEARATGVGACADNGDGSRFLQNLPQIFGRIGAVIER